MSDFTISVAQLNGYVGSRLAQDAFLRDAWIEGEIEKPAVRHGIAYFALVDEEASVDCLIFRDDLSRMESMLMNGQRVKVQGVMSLYRRTGRFRVQVRKMQLAGVGEIFLRLLELKNRLEARGLFDVRRKRPLPALPRRIAVVTSREGAALQDILQVAGRRNPGVAIDVYPALVQGERAPASLVRAISRASADARADILIVARGGGSAGDLSAFNDEGVVEAVAASRIPVVSAVGHETDVSLCDLVADRRAPTPSAAAEIAVPDRDQIMEQLRTFRRGLGIAMQQVLAKRHSQLQAESRALRSLAVTQKLDIVRGQLRFFVRSGLQQLQHLLERRKSELRAQLSRLEDLNPGRILRSGYAVVVRDGRRIHSAAQLRPDDHVQLLFADGHRSARILEDAPDGRTEKH
ncbi:MAG: exodeoxyribonuclease VII large subunit [Clostridia bacterium]|nr:exodeoxyribonuclease VII large subunit [Clostridia bacterium]